MTSASDNQSGCAAAGRARRRMVALVVAIAVIGIGVIVGLAVPRWRRAQSGVPEASAQPATGPLFVARAKITWIDRTSGVDAIRHVIDEGAGHLTRREIAPFAAEDRGLLAAFPNLRSRDFADPNVQAELLAQIEGTLNVEVLPTARTVVIRCARRDPLQASRIANAFARGFVKYCRVELVTGIRKELDHTELLFNERLAKRDQLKRETGEIQKPSGYDPARDEALLSELVSTVRKLLRNTSDAKFDLTAAKTKMNLLEDRDLGRPESDPITRDVILDLSDDSLLTAYLQELAVAERRLKETAEVMRPDHPTYQAAASRVEFVKQLVKERQAEVGAWVREKIQQHLYQIDAMTVAEAKRFVDKASQRVESCKSEMDRVDKIVRELSRARNLIAETNERIAMIDRDIDNTLAAIRELKKQEHDAVSGASIRVAELADVPEKPE